MTERVVVHINQSQRDRQRRGGLGALLDRVDAHLRRFVVFACTEQVHAVTLWVAHTHALEAAHSTPRLRVHAPTEECGKSRLLEVVAQLVAEVESTESISPAALFRVVEEYQPTILMDEVDTIFSGQATPEERELRALLNAGHRRGGTATRCVGQSNKVRRFNVFAPVALSGVGGPGDLPRTLESRCINIGLRRRRADEHIQRFRPHQVAEAAGALREELADALSARLSSLREAEPALPEELSDRQQDCWEPLVAIADAAGGRWPERARRAALHLSGQQQAADQAVTVRLLADLQAVWQEDEEALFTDTLLERLRSLEESPWPTWYGRGFNARDLAKLLRPFEVRSRTIRLGDTTRKGYRRDDLHDPWSRYLPASPQEASHPSPPSQPGLEGQYRHDFDVTDRSQRDGSVTSRNSQNRQSQRDVTDVTDVTDSTGSPEEGFTCTTCGRPAVSYTPQGRPSCQECLPEADRRARDKRRRQRGGRP